MRNKSEIIKTLVEGNLYDYVANHYWEMDKYELKDILLEVIYQYTIDHDENEYKNFLLDVLVGLSERWDTNEEE